MTDDGVRQQLYDKGDKVMCYGIPGGPYPGKIIRKGESKDCWVVLFRHENGIGQQQVHEDYIRRR